jgi:hypothetical protein
VLHAALQGNIHEVNPRDKTIIAVMTERWLTRGSWFE